jgi:hypothetical protein
MRLSPFRAAIALSLGFLPFKRPSPFCQQFLPAVNGSELLLNQAAMVRRCER